MKVLTSHSGAGVPMATVPHMDHQVSLQSPRRKQRLRMGRKRMTSHRRNEMHLPQ